MQGLSFLMKTQLCICECQKPETRWGKNLEGNQASFKRKGLWKVYSFRGWVMHDSS